MPFLVGDNMKVYVIHGSPLSGKTTYVESHRGSNDIIYDFDKLMVALTGNNMHQHNNNVSSYVIAIRDLIITKLKSEKNIDNAWIITTKVSRELNKQLMDLSPEYIEMKIDKATVMERLKKEPGNRDIKLWKKLIDNYFASKVLDKDFHNRPIWRRKRVVILKRDNYICKECKRYGKTIEANTVHHILPIEDRYDLRLDNRNLISLCEECHESMHDKFDNKLSKLGEEWRERIIMKYPELRSPLP